MYEVPKEWVRCMAKKFYWLKLKDDFFDTEEIKLIENMENGKDYIIFLLKLRLKSINSEGLLNFKGIMPYNEKMLSTITNTNIDIVKSALEILQKLKLISIFDDGTIYMEQIKELIGSETNWKDYKAFQREIQKEELLISPPKYLDDAVVISKEAVRFPNGKVQYIDEKRYGGNGKLALERDNYRCVACGSYENLCIHHLNEYSNELCDLITLCRKCHSKEHKSKLDLSKIVQTDKEIDKEKDINIYKEKESDKDYKSFNNNTLKEIKDV